ncbi:CYTH and CHAD domain-containing protein [Mycolicibacterium grossiae]|uniref:CHAD domain-containing protein n=1 Tax=Mycolicibacterium grossiae TaxID=1552759 RepID=A0A1E8PYD9_9MYCO|nr:CYTH and CHAD domain-containing protein [Mycolicibacterium grossiae]OFJ51116.1 CHAD domain-containing protein [Mycolicibacterium grossiae]QEM47165.1 CYTH and CHAD domain-containing protein [Mycolicibacterium grossiae]
MASDKRKASRHTEIERKFAVSEDTVSPSFQGLSAVGRVDRLEPAHLDAVYYDTPGQDLAAHRVTLRRRTGGTDAGWHLKLPAGADARTEVRLPLSEGDAVPDELRDVVLALVRDRDLAPVARISTTRNVDLLFAQDGTPLAEFCDDHVTASAVGGEEQFWREWELELAEGADPALLERLANRLFDAGAEPAGHGSKLAKVLSATAPRRPPLPEDPVHRAVAEQFAELLEWDRAVRADAWDAVHQMRVITRKIRSLVKGSEESFGLSGDAWVLEELKLLAGVLGVARDAEVLAEKYEKALDELPPELVRGPVRQRLIDGAKRRYAAGHKRSLAAMRSERYFRLLDALDELATAEPATTAGGEEPKQATVASAYRKVRKYTKAAREAQASTELSAEEKDEALHRIRKGAKRLRYTAAATGAAEVADRSKAIQSLLGDHQDSVVSRRHLSSEATAAHVAGEDTFTYGLLFAHEDAVARAAEEQLDGVLKQLAKAVEKSG